MANLIKKQILKHLSKFTKNLSPESVNLSALRGEGELFDLDLDCIAIQNLINLPTWLRINHIKCNKVAIKIPWTKTGTTPITIKFDVVDVLMSTCETPRAPNGPSPIQDSSGGTSETSYGSMQRILEGIAIRIDSINVEFTSTVFTALFQVSQLVVFSANPEGFSDDLRATRLINKPSKQVLTFKKISWQTMRIEMKAKKKIMKQKTSSAPQQKTSSATPQQKTSSATPQEKTSSATPQQKTSSTTPQQKEKTSSTPQPNSTTRMITNKASVLITLRRKTSDLSLIASRLHTSFDDLQWVFTISQVQTAMLCVKSINDIIARSHDADKQNLQPSAQPPPTPSSGRPPTPSSGRQTTPSSGQDCTLLPSRGPDEDIFMKHVIYESSFHFDIAKINLVISDDGTLVGGIKCGRKGCSEVVTGGALLLSLEDLSIDHYPRHKAGKNRRHFRNYGQILEARDKWADEIIMRFRQDFINLKKKITTAASNQNEAVSASKLLESCTLIHLGEIEIEQVTSSSNAKTDRNFLSTNRNELHLPDDLPFLSLQITDYFYPDDRKYPSPHKNIFVRLTAPNIHVNWDSVMWMHQLYLSTLVSLNDAMPSNENDVIKDEHVDVRFEALMPKILIPQPKKSDDAGGDVMKNAETPDGIEIQVSELAVTNCRCGKNSSIRYLQSILNLLENSFIKNHPNSFPSCSVENQFEFLSKKFQQYTSGDHEKKIENEKINKTKSMDDSSLKFKATDDVWSIWIRQFWCDFIKFSPTSSDVKSSNTSAFSPSSKKKKKDYETWPFIDSIPLHVWISKDEKASDKINIHTYTEDVAPCGMSCADNEKMAENENGQHQHPTGGGGGADVDIAQEISTSDRPRRMNLMDYYRRDEKPKEEKETKNEAKMNILVQTEKTLNIKLKHFEFLFITDFVKDVQRMQSIMSQDQKVLLRSTELLATQSQSTALRFLCPSLNIYMILGESSQKSNVIDDASSVMTSRNSSMTSLNSATAKMNYEGKSNSMSIDQMSDNLSIFGDDNSSMASYAQWETLPDDSNDDPRSSTLRKDSNELLRNSLKPVRSKVPVDVIALMEDTNSMTSTISDTSLDNDVTKRNHDVISSFVALSSNSTNSYENEHDGSNDVIESPSAGVVDPSKLYSAERTETSDMFAVLCVQIRGGGEICVDSVTTFTEEHSATRIIFQQLYIDEISLKIPKNQNIFASSALRRKMKQLTKEHQQTVVQINEPQVKTRSEAQTKNGKRQKILEMDMSSMEHELASTTFSALLAFLDNPKPTERFPIIVHLGQIYLQLNDDVREIPKQPRKYQWHNSDVTRTTDGTYHFTGLNSRSMKKSENKTNLLVSNEIEKLKKELMEVRKERDKLQEEINKLRR